MPSHSQHPPQTDAEVQAVIDDVFNTIMDPLLVLSSVRENGTIVDLEVRFANHAAVEALSVLEIDIIGQRLCEALPEHRTNGLFDAYARSADTGEAVNFEEFEWMIDENSPSVFLNIRGMQLGDGCTITWHDITAQVLTLRKSEALQQSLERSNASLQRFTSIASHDLQAPLRTIGGYTGLLERRLRDKLEDDERVLFGRVLEGVDAMSALVKNLLEYSKLGSVEESSTGVDLSTAVQLATAALASDLDSAEVELSVDIPEGMTVSGNTRLLAQAVQNLVGNSIRYRDPQRHPEIGISAHIDGVNAVLDVRDNGVGISPEHHDQVFEMFSRLSADASGSGIGLAIVSKIVEQHHGSIEVISDGSSGSTFRITLPEQRS